MMTEVEELVDQVRLSFHAFSEFARRTHGDRIDPPGRAVLEFLSKNPPSTVPLMARSRGVSRQHIQTIVNALVADGLVQASENPAHKRSALFVPTPDGRTLIETIARAELDLLQPLQDKIDEGRLTAAAETLAEVRELVVGLGSQS